RSRWHPPRARSSSWRSSPLYRALGASRRNVNRDFAVKETRGAPSVPPEWPDLDRPSPCDRVFGRDLDGLLQAAALDDVEPADGLLSLDERTVGDDRLAVADADGSGPARRRQLVPGDPAALRLKVVQPREALRIRSVTWIGLGLGVHFLGVPAHKHQEFHVAPLIRIDRHVWTTNAQDRNRRVCNDPSPEMPTKRQAAHRRAFPATWSASSTSKPTCNVNRRPHFHIRSASLAARDRPVNATHGNARYAPVDT